LGNIFVFSPSAFEKFFYYFFFNCPVQSKKKKKKKKKKIGKGAKMRHANNTKNTKMAAASDPTESPKLTHPFGYILMALFSEFGFSFAYSLSLFVFATKELAPLHGKIILGALAWLFLGYHHYKFGFNFPEPARRNGDDEGYPRLPRPVPYMCGGVIVRELLFDDSHDMLRPRRYFKEGKYLLVGRLIVQWIAALFGYFIAFKIRSGAGDEDLIMMYHQWESYGFSMYTTLAMQFVINSFLVSTYVVQATTKEPPNHTAWKAYMQTGILFAACSFPSLGISWSLVSYAWLQHAYKMPSVGVFLFSNVTVLVSGVAGNALAELMRPSVEKESGQEK